MAALAASVRSWIPEDDLLLKNAIEAGASLEALAKGAVRFSRKFTVRELQERWHALLYDADVSAEASARMVELELSDPKFRNNGSKPGGSVSREVVENSTKRKVESVRRLYYAMRKKSRGRNSDAFDIDFLGALDGDECLGFEGPGDGSCVFSNHDDQSHFDFVQKIRCGELPVDVPSFDHCNVKKDAEHLVADGLVNFQSCAGIEAMAMPREITGSSPPFHVERIASPLLRMPLWKTIEDVPAPEMPMDECVENKDRSVENSMTLDVVNGDGINSSGVKTECKDTVIDNGFNAISESDFADLSDTLLNFGNEDEQPFINMDGQDILDKSCHDGANLLLDNAPNDELPEVKELQTSVTNTCSAELEIVAEDSKLVPDNGTNPPSCADSDPPSSISAPHSLSAEQSCGEMECLLNTEDTEIPCNDDVCLSKPYPSYAKQTTSKRADYLSSYSNRKDSKQEVITMKREDNPVLSLRSSQMPASSPSHQYVNHGVKSESPGISPAAASGKIGNPHVNSSHFRSCQTTPTSNTVGVLKADSLHACSTMNIPSHTGMSSPSKGNLVPEAEPSANEEESSSDDDVPSFSDIEAMILEMDLCPEDSSSLTNSEVLKYQNDEMKKSIIRLEQCARSSMQRAIASRGALAVLYGRHLKHHIRDTEVILGRATDDVDVDIDLGREGPANKISRRQALIKMEGDGSFFLKNLGKGPMYLNGTELLTGQRMSLGSSSLIEIRGMAFLFEMDSKSVRRHLENIAKTQRQGSVKFEWSEVPDKG